jgi:membrane-bound lytic murein transglycosylase F
MPSLSVAMDLTEGQNLGWYLAQGATKLTEQAFSWMNSREGDEAVDRMERRHYAYITEFDYVDLRTLNRRIEERLPQYRDLFLTAEEETGMPADLLAALSYQESHWNPNARSPTGVRGMMMLTQNTARSLGVTNRLDPEQSILAGARYLEDRHRRLPEQIPEPDRLFLALASYNVGRGHLLDARQLARNLGKNPDSWADMREVLPLLSDERYYPQLRYGYARGYEPVHFVQRVRNYRDVLSQAFD